MGQLLNSGKVGNIQVNQLREQREQVVNRWEQTGLLEGLSDQKKTNIAQLLENQAYQLLKETNTTTDIMGFDIIAFPMVRRIFSRLLANDIVSVQPMNLPSGLIFYLDNQVETAITGTRGTYSSVYDAHYNNGGHNYSFGTATTRTEAVTAVAANAVTLPYSGGEDSLGSLEVLGYSGATELGPVRFAINPQTWTLDLFASNQISVTVPRNIPSATTGGTSGLTSAATRWYGYAALEAADNMAEVKLVLSSVTVQVQSRKMRAEWTPELAQDLAAYHSIDAEAELTALLSEELAAEIDREIIRDLINVAPHQLSWSYDKGTSIIDLSGRTIAPDAASGYVTQKEWNQTFLTAINKVSAAIHKATLRGGANWILCSTEIGSVIDDIEKFHAANDVNEDTFNMGIEKIGTLGTRYTVYKDPYLPDWVCLIGHKGSSFLDTGYVYAPYIPFQLTPVVLSPTTYVPSKGIMTRYAKKVVNNKHYGLVKVHFPTSYKVINAI